MASKCRTCTRFGYCDAFCNYALYDPSLLKLIWVKWKKFVIKLLRLE